MSSTHYVIQADVMGIGGNTSTSTGYKALDTVGDTATGSDLTSTNYRGCAGYECFQGAPYISFSVKEGTASPGTAGAGVSLGALTTGAVKTSDGSAVNSIFLTAESNANGGVVTSVTSQNAGLKRTSAPTAVIPSATATLVAGTEGYGVCVFSATQGGDSPTSYAKSSPYNGTCTTTTGHAVGIVDGTSRTILSSSGQLSGGQAEVLVKAAISPTTGAGSDYADNLTFILTGTY